MPAMCLLRFVASTSTLQEGVTHAAELLDMFATLIHLAPLVPSHPRDAPPSPKPPNSQSGASSQVHLHGVQDVQARVGVQERVGVRGWKVPVAVRARLVDEQRTLGTFEAHALF